MKRNLREMARHYEMDLTYNKRNKMSSQLLMLETHFISLLLPLTQQDDKRKKKRTANERIT